MKLTDNSRLRRFICAAALCVGLATFGNSAEAQTCPSRQDNFVLAATRDGYTEVRTIYLTGSYLNPTGTTTLCRYVGQKYSVPARDPSAAVSQGSYRYYRYYSSKSDPANAWVVRLWDNGGIDPETKTPYPPGFLCSGSAISPDWVLTAEHCAGVAPGTEVYGGVTTRAFRICAPTDSRNCWDVPNPSDQSVTVAQVYKYGKSDLMLVRLAKPLVLTAYGVVCCSSDELDGVTATQYGWTCDGGGTRSNCPNGRRTLWSQKLEIRDEQGVLEELGILPPNMACTHYFFDFEIPGLCANGGSSAPSVKEMGGHSGGPIVRNGGIKGIFSGGRSKKGGYDYVLADATEAAAWVRSTTGVIEQPKKF